MNLNERISEERARLAQAKQRLRGRRQELGLGGYALQSQQEVSSVSSACTGMARAHVEDSHTRKSNLQNHYYEERANASAQRQRLDLSDFAANRRFDYRSPKSRSARGVSVRVTSRSTTPTSSHSRSFGYGGHQTPRSVAGSAAGTPRARALAPGAGSSSVCLPDAHGEILRQASTREAALAAKASLHERKLAYAEKELTAQADLLEEVKLKHLELTEELTEARSNNSKLRKEKQDCVTERDVARQRVYSLSERVSDLEKELKATREELKSKIGETTTEAADAKEKVGSLEHELANVRASLVQTRQRLERTSTLLEDMEARALEAEARADKLEEENIEIKQAFTAEKEGREEYSDKCKLLEQELKHLRAALSDESGSAEQHEAAIAEVTNQLAAERERASSLEASLKTSLMEARESLEKTRKEAKEAFDRAATAEQHAKIAEEDRKASMSHFQEQYQVMHEQMARNTLATNAQTDALRLEMETLRAQMSVTEATSLKAPFSSNASVNSATSSVINYGLTKTTYMTAGDEDKNEDYEIGTKGSVPALPSPTYSEVSEKAMLTEIEELLVDVDLPDGSCAELIVRSTDDPAEAIARFSTLHSLSPRVAAHLEEYVCAQLQRTCVRLPKSPSARPTSPPPPPPPVAKEPEYATRRNQALRSPYVDTSTEEYKDDGLRGMRASQGSSSSPRIPRSAGLSTQVQKQQTLGSREPSRMRRLSQLRK
mmetsp:Transcript_2049/g.4650  ORF Transcript_2049/g.4650 Transcript_2049/m.4650 type:complete len:720 (-) Transcript_2049:189-2348(-)